MCKNGKHKKTNKINQKYINILKFNLKYFKRKKGIFIDQIILYKIQILF